MHIDHTAHAYAKALLDGIFGKTNFRNEIVWCYASGGVSQRWFGKKHDTILFYSKSRDYCFNPQYRPYSQGTMERGLTQYKKRLNEKYELRKEGAIQNDWWVDVTPLLSPTQKERSGYPTQKPLALYERIIAAGSNPGNIVLDPFCGCATTPIAAERLGRQWVGMDIWDQAFEIVQKRLEDNRQLLEDILTIHYATMPPARTDTGQEAAPTLTLKVQVPEPPGLKMSHAEMKQFLIQNEGVVCKGCLRKFDDERYLDLDHNVPRSDGGINHISNRMLLCGPCNRAKSNMLTLSGLRKLNKQNDWMARI